MRNFHWIAKHTQRTFPILLDREEKTVSIIDAPSIFQWDLQSGKLLRQVKLENPFPPKLNSFERFAFSSDGAQLIGCAEGQGRIWDFQSGKVVKSWTTKSQSVPVDFSPDARVVIYLLRSLRPNYSFVDTSTGKVQWKLNGSLPFPHTFADGGHEMWFPKKANCEIRDAYTGKTKRYNAFPCQRDGEILRVTSDYIYTQNDKGTVFRWRAR
ncbi:WD40 repeat domain-containing protein [bacterium]|nr:MAG: WD40 repeat domain-containing protein [bacterium]